MLHLQGTKSNRSAIGATVVVRAGGRRQARVVLSQSSYYSHDDLRVHVGLGSAVAAEEVEIRWPSGGVQRIENVKADQLLKVVEGAQAHQ
jgi:hypothetical protein